MAELGVSPSQAWAPAARAEVWVLPRLAVHSPGTSGEARLAPCAPTPAWNKSSYVLSFTLVFYYNCTEWDHFAKRKVSS